MENLIIKFQEKLISVENDQADWVLEWAQAINGLGLKTDAHPAQATEAFDQLLKFFDKFDKSEELRRRIYGIDQVAEKFEKKVFKLVDSIGFNRENQEAVIVAAKLNHDLNESREARAAFQKIDRQKKEVEDEIEDADIVIRTIRDTLASLRATACVETDDELETACESSREMRDLQLKKNDLEQELMRNGDGLSIQELEKEAADSDVDAIEGELEQVLSELEELLKNRDTLRDKRQILKNEIKAKDGSAIAANASEEAEQQLASMVSGIEKYLRLRMAALILEQQIEEYRQENQAPVLARAGQLFSKLTLGGYANLRDELDKKGQPVLLGVRPNNDEVPVKGMSDGTRDQLYLSLRLATLEQHMSKGEPMPLVVDDILIGFDDNRTKACLEVLSELALNTQVLLFTHHRRVLEISGELEAEAGIFKYELG